MTQKAAGTSLEYTGITDASHARWNLLPDELAAITVRNDMGTTASNGALVVETGEFTGRSPKDRFIVRDDITENAVDWNDINKPFDPAAFDALQAKVADYLSGREIYVRDAYAGAEPAYQLKLRAVTEYPWSNLFAYNMFIRPDEADLADFAPEWTILCAPGFEADPAVDGTRQHNFAIINFTKKTIIIGGTAYTGEIKKGIFSVLNFILPHDHDVLSMHCSANVGEAGDTALFFGLSGTGKTTLSADPNRGLIGDDEHGWHDGGVFNFEGGCYAKVIDLSAEKEPDIYQAIRPGAILENIVFKPGTKEPDYHDSSITQNTRVSYPIHHIRNAVSPSTGGVPRNIFFLTYDAFGVLPPISRLNEGQAMYHFISGFTSKVAGTEAGINEPQTAFSACYGAPFLPLHPTTYADMLGERMRSSGATVWLVNTGLVGGSYGTGERMSLRHTRALVTAALGGDLDDVGYTTHPVFGVSMPTSCPKVPDEVLDPKGTWSDPAAYDEAASKLAAAFNENFEQFASEASDEMLAAAPKA